MGDEQRRHPGLVQADADAKAGHARLRDLEDRVADLVAVADANLVVSEPLHGEVLAELAVDEVVSLQLLLPVAIRLDLVDEHRAVLAAVGGSIGLVVAVDVDAPDHAPAVDWLFPDRGADGLALPGNVAGSADVEGQQPPYDGSVCAHDRHFL